MSNKTPLQEKNMGVTTDDILNAYRIIDISKIKYTQGGDKVRNLKKLAHGTIMTYQGEVYDIIQALWIPLEWFSNGDCNHFFYPASLNLKYDNQKNQSKKHPKPK